MMKTSVMRQARFCRVALRTTSLVPIASRASPFSSAGLSASPMPHAAPYRSATSPLRFFSSESAAPEQQPISSSPITKFAELTSLGVDASLVNSITDGMKYTDMSEVQSATINAALEGKDLVAQARTGTGKTLAFLVPVLQRILLKQPELAYPGRSSGRGAEDIRAIIVSPTRELAEQIAAEAQKLVRGTQLVVQTAVGGTQKHRMVSNARRQGCHLLVATPGRLLDLLSDPDSRIAAPNLEALVLDEADRMLDIGFDTELREILKLLPDRRDVQRQTLLFSATIPKNVVGLARNYIDPANFEFVQTIKPDEAQTHDRVPQFVAPCKDFANLLPTLLELIERETAKAQADPESLPFKALIFLPTTAYVILTHAILENLHRRDRSLPPAIDIHGQLNQAQRTRNASDFKTAKSAVLISTDVTARGMDFPDVSHVIQVHLPNERDSYIHRLGRTGRAGKLGQGWLLLPDLQVSDARKRLAGLPIQRNTDLACSTVDAIDPTSPLPEQFERIKEAMSRLPSRVLEEAFRSLSGSGALKGVNANDIRDGLRNEALYGWGLPEVPSRMSRTSRPGHGRGVGSRGGDRHSSDPFERTFSRVDDRRGGPGRYDDRDRGGFGDRRGDRGGYGDRRGDRGGSDDFNGGRPRTTF